MALITCPECGKEVSDTSKKCVHCGYKFKNGKGGGKGKKVIIISVIIVAVLAVALSVFFVLKAKRDKELMQQREKKYIQTMENFRDTVIDGGSEAENLCNIIVSVWGDAINEDIETDTSEYTYDFKKHEFYDFDTALSNLFKSDKYSKMVHDLGNNKSKVEEFMTSLKEYPNERYEQYFDYCSELYNQYTLFYDFAVNTSGSYKDYSEKYNEIENDFLKKFNELKNAIELLKD